MEYMNILQYFNTNVSKEEWDKVQKVYAYELAGTLEDLGMQDKETFNLAELAVIFTRVSLEKDLDAMQSRLLEISNGDNEETVKEFIDNMEYRYDFIVELNGGLEK